MTHKIISELKSDVNDVISQGELIRIKHYTGSASTSDYDDVKSFTQSGIDVWTSGVVLPVSSSSSSSNEAILLQQGKIFQNDSKIFIKGDVETTETMKIGLGSPVTQEYGIIPVGIIAIPSYGEPAFKKMYVRYLTNGSLTGE